MCITHSPYLPPSCNFILLLLGSIKSLIMETCQMSNVVEHAPSICIYFCFWIYAHRANKYREGYISFRRITLTRWVGANNIHSPWAPHPAMLCTSIYDGNALDLRARLQYKWVFLFNKGIHLCVCVFPLTTTMRLFCPETHIYC